MLASDDNNPNFLGARNPDSALMVKFHRKAVLQPFQTKEQARPIYQDVDYIEIFTPGSQLNIIDTPVRDEHKRRFPQQWANYQAKHGNDNAPAGTPVSAWPFLTGAQAEEFKAVKFFTVEQIANASDFQLQSLGMIGGANPHVIRERAKAYLQAASGAAPAESQAAELAETKAQLAEMQKTLAVLTAQQNGIVSTAEPTAPKKRGRKPKVTVEAAPVEPTPPVQEMQQVI
jgi:hypothetical protein